MESESNISFPNSSIHQHTTNSFMKTPMHTNSAYKQLNNGFSFETNKLKPITITRCLSKCNEESPERITYENKFEKLQSKNSLKSEECTLEAENIIFLQQILSNCICQELLEQESRIMEFIHKLDDISLKQFALLNFLPFQLKPLQVDIRPRARTITNKTIVFDMDGTLIKTLGKVDIPDTKCEHHYIYLEDRIRKVFAVRPYVSTMLAILKPYFEIVIFTSSVPEYADQILDKLDPLKSIFSHRFYRDSCTSVNSYVVKNLEVLGRFLNEVVLVDDCITCFRAQIENGIPIKSFNGSSEDHEY